MPGGGHKFERHASVTQQRRLALQYERNAWLGPPSDVRTPFEVAVRLNLEKILTGILDYLRRCLQRF